MTAPADFNAGTALTGRKRWAALVFLALGVAMIILDATVVNVAIPTMVQDLDLSTTDAEWVSAAYSLTFASLLILWGRIADRSGRRCCSSSASSSSWAPASWSPLRTPPTS